ncbi:dual specificity protein phosphatase 1B-like isoform X2 [Phoenix dactylifera]|uniref:Dual specificity protein phosphatase 1B-like isoform X2 n=1 Tax=Phoenix dactylifera TaxID=42345 RepID=A0A8B7CVD8_PHODC|nr:dual specificity protein phosphatase 1B-like isoform X2 [Phoenix dactylifera]XP_008807220.2 dual specificity protein phosphatase 1B-like isoform X2 [Phoenix dactylifera]
MDARLGAPRRLLQTRETVACRIGPPDIRRKPSRPVLSLFLSALRAREGSGSVPPPNHSRQRRESNEGQETLDPRRSAAILDSSKMSLIGGEHGNRITACLQAFYAIKYANEDNVPCKIEEGLFLGSVGVALKKEVLKSLNITHILIVAKSLDPAFPNDFVYKKIEVLDTPDTNLQEYFDECFSFIDEAKRAGGGVLVHCFAGRSRSVTIIAAYLMKKYQMSLSHALSLVRSKRPQIAPNRGFMTQLENYGKSLGVIEDAKST